MKKSIWKVISGIFLSIVCLTLGGIVVAYYMMRAPLPDYSGEFITTNTESDIEVFYDSSAVPYIFASTDKDAFYALGFAHARERMFQMDLTRRVGQGRLSEIFGSKTVHIDKMFRTIGFNDLALKSMEYLDNDTKEILQSYSNGINDYLKNNFNYSIEFDVLNYEPEEWTPVHTLIIVKLLAWELNLSWWSDIAYTHITQKLGKELVMDLIPGYPKNSPSIIPKNIKNFADVGLDFIKLNQDYKSFTGFGGTHLGSNNWVVDSSRSTSGAPIIANDPHLSLQAPGKWYLCSVKGDNINTQGFTLPGVPAMVIGKNENISWVVTNIMADDSDFYIEELDSFKTKYKLNNRWKDLTVIKDTFSVKDSADAVLTIRKTHRGPIISDIHLYNKLFENEFQNKADISMRWSSFEFHNEMNSILNLNRASNWTEFKSALSDYCAPGQNFVYADKDGNIGYICATKIPIRSSNNPSFIYDGTTTKDDWSGFVPFERMPKIYNPISGNIATANNKVSESFRYYITNIWEPTSRIERITELLEGKEKHSVEDFMNYQMDFKSIYSKDLMRHVLSAFNDKKVKGKNLNLAIKLLERWDYNLNKDSQVPTIYAVFYNKLMKNIFLDEMGEELFKEYTFLANVPLRTILKLLDRGYSYWFDDKNTTKIETKNDIVIKSFIDAIIELESKFGNNIANWQWGNLHKVEFKHFFDGQAEIIDNIVNIGPFELGGDATSVFKASYAFSKPYDVQIGPSMRYIYDFSNQEAFYYILPTGQSGHIFSKHYDDMSTDWLEGKFRKLFLKEEFIRQKLENKVLIRKSN